MVPPVGVTAAPDPDEAAATHLGPGGVGEGLHGVGAIDGVAVEVEKVVDLRQIELAVVAEDADDGVPKPPTPEADRVGDGWAQWWAVVDRRAPGVEARDPRPEPVSHVSQPAQELAPLCGDVPERGVEPVEIVEHLGALLLEGEPGEPGDATGPPQLAELVLAGPPEPDRCVDVDHARLLSSRRSKGVTTTPSAG